MEQRALKNVNTYLNTNIDSYLETSGGQSYILYLKVVHFSTPVLIRHLWQLQTVVFLHWCLICAVLLDTLSIQTQTSLLGFLITFVHNFHFNLVVMFVYFVNQSSVIISISLDKLVIL
jgi:hypothetical protein